MPLRLTNVRFSMRVLRSLRFLLKAGCGVAALWLVSASTADAAPGPARNIVGRACSPKAAPVRKLIRQSKAAGGPVALPSKRAMAGLSDVTALFRRATHASFSEDDEAIQSDTAAAQIDDDRAVPALRALGVLRGLFVALPRVHTFSPRSPRGPPIQP